MKTETRIYRVDITDEQGKTVRTRLVETTHPDRATGHVAKGLIRARVATQQDLRDLRELDVEVPQAGPTRKIGTVRVAFTIPKTASAEMRAAGEKYLGDAGERATEEGLKEAMRIAIQENLQVEGAGGQGEAPPESITSHHPV